MREDWWEAIKGWRSEGCPFLIVIPLRDSRRFAFKATS
jgi:hypothetical protein